MSEAPCCVELAIASRDRLSALKDRAYTLTLLAGHRRIRCAGRHAPPASQPWCHRVDTRPGGLDYGCSEGSAEEALRDRVAVTL